VCCNDIKKTTHDKITIPSIEYFKIFCFLKNILYITVLDDIDWNFACVLKQINARQKKNSETMYISFLLNLAIVRIVHDWPCIIFLGHRNNNSVRNREKNYNLSNFFCYSMFGHDNIIPCAYQCVVFDLI